MATTAAPYGFRPVEIIGGKFNTNSFRQIPIASNYATKIGLFDVVKLAATGTVQKDAGTSTATPVGIFMGCRYTDPNTNQPTYKAFYNGSIVAADIFAYVSDDPDVVFQAQADGSLAQAALGQNIGITQGAVSSFGNSTISLASATLATTSTLPIRIVDFVVGPFSAVGDAFTDVLCVWNSGTHAYRNSTGV